MHHMALWSGRCTEVARWHVFYGKIRNLCYFCPPMSFPLNIFVCRYPRCLGETGRYEKISWRLLCTSSILRICGVWMWQTNCGRRMIRKTAPKSGATGFFLFLLDMTVANMFIIYMAECKRKLQKPVSHFQLWSNYVRPFYKIGSLKGTPYVTFWEVIVILSLRSCVSLV
jgi:hypothetical protein